MKLKVVEPVTVNSTDAYHVGLMVYFSVYDLFYWGMLGFAAAGRSCNHAEELKEVRLERSGSNACGTPEHAQEVELLIVKRESTYYFSYRPAGSSTWIPVANRTSPQPPQFIGLIGKTFRPTKLTVDFDYVRVQERQAVAVTGVDIPSMASFDRLIIDLMTRYSIPGAALAVAKDGRLVFAHGYGLADVENTQPVQPESLFRIGSISKPITAVTIFKLVEEGKLDLDAKAFRILDNIKPPPGAQVDSRIYDVMVRHLLQHSGGWDRAVIGEPVAQGKEIAKALGVPCPANKEQIISYIMGLPLPFTPGTKFAYTGFEYSLLGHIIEKLTGQNYEEYVKTNVLAPMGINCMRVGHTRLKDRAQGEVRYYDYPGARLVAAVCPDELGPVPAPYAAYLEGGRDASGAWTASAIDLLRFVTAVDGRRPPAFLKPETIRVMLTRSNLPGSGAYAMGWAVNPVGNDANWWHDGALDGTAALLVRDGQTGLKLSWAVVFNSLPQNADVGELDRVLWQAVNQMTEWPTHDLFGQYP